MSCGIVGSGPGFGDKEIVAAGGTNIGNARDYVEIYNIANNEWRTAQPLPQTLLGAATVQYQASVNIIISRGHQVEKGVSQHLQGDTSCDHRKAFVDIQVGSFSYQPGIYTVGHPLANLCWALQFLNIQPSKVYSTDPGGTKPVFN